MAINIAVPTATRIISPWFAALLANGNQADESLDYLTYDAAQLFDAPIVMINLISHNELIFKSCVGNKQGGSMQRKGSFCSLAAGRNGLLNIPNTEKDPRFKTYALVSGKPGIKSYLGIPLKSPDGTVIGTFCVMDTKPRKFAKQQINLLTVMAASAEAHLALDNNEIC